MTKTGDRKVMRVLAGETVFPPPIWLMRQAGRYLPEYRATRKTAKGFLDLCYTPDLAVEVTLQPIRRFGFDAAILFSDILVIPDALDRNVRFVEGTGPLMDPISPEAIAALDASNLHRHLAPVYETVRRLRAELPAETTLLGFCGAPWTVATYMIAGRGTPDQAPARLFAMQHPKEFMTLLTLLADLSADYLIAQIDAGADAVQIFDSWAGVLSERDFARYSIAPVKHMVDRIRKERPGVPVIGFAKAPAHCWKIIGLRPASTALVLTGRYLPGLRVRSRRREQCREIWIRFGWWLAAKHSMKASTKCWTRSATGR